ncbi:MAG: PaaI family thioesterase [Myxococcales bacterium]|nr:PaaI family thioesterase [Myxococcales bacterium]
MTDEAHKELVELNRRFEQAVPHNRALGLEILAFERARVTYRLPYSERLVGNPETGVLHGGAISAAMDAACGSAVFQALPRPMTIATLDLRIDYVKLGTPRRDILLHAHCYKVTRSVAFVRAVAYHDSEDDPIATATGTFMLGTRVSLGRTEDAP